MFRNYLKTAIRSLLRHRLYTALNIAGLSFGLTCFLLIGLYLFNELTFDNQHIKADRIYRVIEHKSTPGESTVIAAAGYMLAEESPKKVPGVESTTRLQRIGRANLVNPGNPTNLFQETVTIADEHFLDIFDFPLLYGNRKTALAEPNSILIDEALAIRLFNRIDVVGKTLQFSFLPVPLTVTGILKTAPKNSSLTCSSILSEATYRNTDNFKQSSSGDWLSENYSVYALLKPGADPQLAAKNMATLVREHFTPETGTRFSFSLQPLKDIHLYSGQIVDGARNSNVEAMATGSLLYVKIFFYIALFVLLIAAINYMNLTTARASSRFKEIGVRKSVGALRGNLIRQFLLESLLVTCISFGLSVLAVNLLLPAFNAFSGKELSLGLTTDYRIWMLAMGFTLFTAMASGSYPALLLSGFEPVSLLKNVKHSNRSGLSLRKSLVVFQFTLSVFMMVATLVLFLQVRFLKTAKLGFNKDLLVVIDVNTAKARSNFLAVKTEMAKIPAVQDVSVTSRVPGEWKSFRTVKIKPAGDTRDADIAYLIGADKDFLKTFGIQLLSGRNFSSPNDSSMVLLNETAARRWGVKMPAEQMLEIPAFSSGEAYTPLNDEHIPFRPKVIGIVQDFHFQSLRDKIEPLVLAYNQNPVQPIDYYTVKISATDIPGTLDRLKTVMVENDKNEPFEYHFLDGQLARFYLEDERRQTMLICAACATIFIACLGLFGLATFSAEQRVKEIGVRKVLGAGVYQLATLLSKDFLKLVLIANGIAIPIAWWATSYWLREYAYHIQIEWWFFGVAAVLATGIALVTVSYQALQAARANPVQSLRTE